MTNPRPCSPDEAVQRALSMLGVMQPYVLGTGDYRPDAAVDVPWTQTVDSSGLVLTGSDCAGFAISWCYKLPRHRPGYNAGAWASVSDDLNCNSAIEDAEHACELFRIVDDRPQSGDLIAYPTIRLRAADGQLHVFIGHVCIVIGTDRVPGMMLGPPDYSLLDVVHCHGPNGRKPACTRSDGSIWNRHTEQWPKPEHRSKLLRAVP